MCLMVRVSFLILLSVFLFAPVGSAQPIQLHPDNPRYFLYEGEPTLLITSAEHYGAVLNLDFDYKRYLDTLAADGMNMTRVFSGVYCEVPGSFNIEKNTLAPFPNRFISPWARSAVPGYARGGNKFDLTKYDDAYFVRLHDFLRYADTRGVIVEYVFFCPLYREVLWDISPMNAKNNVNDIGKVNRTQVYALKEKALTKVQEAVVRKVVRELAEYENLFYEICNEPYFHGVTMEFQHRIADIIVEEESFMDTPHLIAQNIANVSKVIKDPHPEVDIFNFHYAYPPDAVAQNYKLQRPIGYDETGFRGDSDTRYRGDAWAFILAGGALYNNLDYSFTVDGEDGTVSQEAPGGGSPALRFQLRTLHEFMKSFDFICMEPMPEMIRKKEPKQTKGWALENEGIEYALYFQGDGPIQVTLQIPRGDYLAEWMNVVTGETTKRERLRHSGGNAVLSSPIYYDDIALSLRVE